MAELIQFTGMLSTTASQFLRKDDTLEVSINVHGDQVGLLTKRLGYSAFGSALSASTIQGLRSYADITGGTTRLFAASNGSIYYYDGAAWNLVTTYGFATANIDMRVFLDQLFVVGADSSSNFITPINIDGTTASTGTNLASAPQAKYVEVFQDQIYFANTKAAGVRYPSRVVRSSLPDTSATTITWPSTNYDNVMTNNGEEITGIHTNKALNQMLIFKDSSSHAWDGFRIRDIGNVGTSNFRSIQTINFSTFWYSAVARGIYAYSGVQPQLISRPIEKWIRGIADPTVVHAGKEEEKFYKLYIGNTTVDGVTYSNCEIRYSVPDNTFTVYSYADNFKIYAEHKVSNVTRLYSGNASGSVFQLALDPDAVYSDNNSPIAAQFQTKPLDLNQPESKKFIDRLCLYSVYPQNLQGRMREYGKDWSSWFKLNKTIQYENISPLDANFIQFDFSESSTDAPFIFQGLSMTGGKTTNYV